MKKLLISLSAFALLATALPARAMQQQRGEQCVNCHTRRATPTQQPVQYAQQVAPTYYVPVAAPVMAIPQAVCNYVQPFCRPAFFGFRAGIHLPFFGFGFHFGL